MKGTQAIEIKVLTQASGEAFEFLRACANRFEQDHPSIEVILEQINGNYEVQKTLQLSNSYDLIHMSESTFIPFLEQNRVRDLTPYMTSDPDISLNDFYKGALVGPSDGAKIAAIPVDIAVELVFCRKELFKQAALPLPDGIWNFDQFIEMASALTQEDNDGMTWGLRLDIDIERWEPLIKRGGGAYLSPDGTQADGYLNNDKTTDMFHRIVDWYSKHKVLPGPEEISEFPFDPRYAMVIELSSWIPYLEENLQDEYIAVPLPLSKGGQESNMMYMGGYGISSDSPHPQEAWEFLKSFALFEICDSPRSLPVLKTTAKNKDRADHPLWSVALREFERGAQSAFYVNRNWNASRQLINRDIRSWLDGKSIISEDLKKWSAHISKLPV